MITINGRKCVCLATSNESVRASLTQLWEKGVDCFSTTTVAEAIQLITAHQPDFLLLAHDHPNYHKVTGLVKAIQSKTKITVIAFVEKDSPALLNRLTITEAEYQLWPPLDGSKIIKLLSSILEQHPERFYKKVNDQKKVERHTADGKTVRMVSRPTKKSAFGSLGEALQRSLDQICKVNGETEFYKTIKEINEVVAIPLVGDKIKGFLVGAVGSPSENRDEKLRLIDEVTEFSQYWTKTKSLDFELMNPVHLSIPATDFQSWGLSDGEFVKSAYHDDYQISFSFFRHHRPVPDMKEADDSRYLRVGPGQFVPGQILNSEIKVWLPSNKKFHTIGKPNSFLRRRQIEKVKEASHPYFYVLKEAGEKVYDHLVSGMVHVMIEDFGYSFVEETLRARRAKKRDQDRMKDEIKGAKGVQDFLFPDTHYIDEDFELRGFYQRASETGGDWWHYDIKDRKAWFWIGDATGHGLPAAMVTAAAKSAAAILKDLPELPLEQSMSVVNSAILASGGGEVLMTFFVGCLELDTGVLSYCNASHDFPMIFPSQSRDLKKGDILFLNGNSSQRLGESHKTDFFVNKTKVRPGDRLVFFTDGVVELENKQGSQWGERKFLSTMLKAFNSNTGVTAPMQLINKAIEDHRQSAPFVDDLTYFLLLYKPGARKVKKSA